MIAAGGRRSPRAHRAFLLGAISGATIAAACGTHVEPDPHSGSGAAGAASSTGGADADGTADAGGSAGAQGSGGSSDDGLCACVQGVFDGLSNTPCDQCYMLASGSGHPCEAEFQACDARPLCNDTSAHSVPQCLIDCAGAAACEWKCLTWEGDGDPIGSPEAIDALAAYLACACRACPVCAPAAPEACAP